MKKHLVRSDDNAVALENDYIGVDPNLLVDVVATVEETSKPKRASRCVRRIPLIIVEKQRCLLWQTDGVIVPGYLSGKAH